MKSISGKWFSYSAFLVLVFTIGLGLVLMNSTALGMPGSPRVTNIASLALVLPLGVHLMAMMVICLTRGKYQFEMPLFLPKDQGQLFLVIAMTQQMSMFREIAPLAHPSVRPLVHGLYLPVLTVVVLLLLTNWQNRVVAESDGLRGR